LVFFTNDGDFARIVTHPSTEVEKEYRVETQQEIPEEMLREYQAGVVIDGESLKLRSYRYKTPRSAQITLAQGKNREIRRVFASWKITIKKLHRIRIGTVKLEQLPPGQYRPLSQKEVSWFRSQAKTTAGRGARNRGTRR
jgi:23S rRNA pseudouridine2605 synthase